MNFAELIPAGTDRVLFCGMTGCGKSKLAEYLLAFRRNVIIHDAKDEIFWKGFKRYTSITKLAADAPQRAIYAPSLKELESESHREAFFKYVYLRGNVTVYIDEAYAVTDGQNLPFYYKACITRGRSKGIEVWSATQRPIDIPQFLMSETEHKFIFYLQMPQDREKVRKITGISEDTIQSLSKERHEFFYANLNRLSGKLKLTGVK